MKERSIIYLWIRLGVYAFAASMPIFLFKKQILFEPTVIEFASIIGSYSLVSTLYILKSRSFEETWIWGLDVNPFCIWRWKISGIEFVSSSSLLFAISSYCKWGLNFQSLFWLGVGMGGFIGLSLAGAIAKRAPSKNNLDKYVVRSFWSVPKVLFIIILTIIMAVFLFSFFLIPVGKDDAKMYSLVSMYLKDRYGDSSQVSLTKIRYFEKFGKDDYYIVHFKSLGNEGDLRITFYHDLSGRLNPKIELIR